ncbi:CD109 antigen-like [Saccostrea echinata]|uniref:CD109 antigen-like n=1 Tax=Saccostrea echinata TaxID=191078 RepID=UPI002A809975|nr:CD109 antigen-like [Saccostrea echinata]
MTIFLSVKACTEPSADIVFVLDSSGSIGSSNFQSILSFVRDMTSSFDFSNGKTKVSVVTFSSRVYEAFPLNAYQSASAIADAVSRVPYYAGGTDTASALRYVENYSFIASKGAAMNSSRIVIVITDGQSNDPAATKIAAEALRSIGVTTYSIGIGSGIGQRELENIASDINHVFRVSNYNALQQVQLSLGVENCHVVDIYLPWESSGKSPNYLWNSPNTRATPVDIETSAYTLLYYVKSQKYVQAQKILKWILKQRNANGGFASTQDTVLALQALSELTHSQSGNSLLDLNIIVNTHNESHSVKVNEKNKMVLQKFQPSGVPDIVNVTASGHGAALVQVAVNYNVKEQIEKPAFLIDVSSLKETMETITTRMCTSYNTSAAVGSGMAIVEYGVPSGFEVDMESISYHQNLKKSELDDRNVVLYFDEITRNEACVTVNVERSTLVANIKPSPVRVYEYYNPEHQVTTFYTPSILKQTSYCDVCPTCPCGTKTK